MLHKKYVNRGFTLVELLSVIVILAIILVIAVPKIMDVINSSKKSTLETSAKMIASAAEKIRMQNKLLGKEDDTITCDSVAKISSKDYSNCTIIFNNNEAIVSINGIGKFNGINVCNATKNKAETSEDKCPTDERFFAYDTIFDESNLDEDAFVYSAEVVDVDKCTTHLNSLYAGNEENNSALCNGTYDGYTIYDFINYGNMDIKDASKAGISLIYKKLVDVQINAEKCTNYLNSKYSDNEENNSALCNGTYDGYTIKDAIKDGTIPEEDYETAGLNVSMEDYTPTAIITGYNILGGENVVIPKEIDGYKVDEVLNYALYNENIKSIEVPKTITKINDCAFGDKTRLTSSNISSSYTCNNKPTNGALTLINKLGDNDILNSYAQYNDTTYHAGIRYTGSDPDNYVYFNCDDNSDTSTCEIWRIIGVFNIDGEERIKIINSTSTFWNIFGKSDSDINGGYGINQWGPSTYGDGTIYEGADLYQLLNGFYIGKTNECFFYKNSSGYYAIPDLTELECSYDILKDYNMKPLSENSKKFISEAKWGTYAVDDIERYLPVYSEKEKEEVWLKETGISARYVGKECSDEDETYCNDTIVRTVNTRALVGLMNISDILYSKGLNSRGWLYNNFTYPWTLTPYVSAFGVWSTYTSHSYIYDFYAGDTKHVFHLSI